MKAPKLLFVESGHGRNWYGRKDPGATTWYHAWNRRVTERELTVAIGEKVLKILIAKLPESIVLGVGIETEANVWAKTRYMNKVRRVLKFKKEDCFAVSLHVNGNYPKASGIEGFYQTKNLGGLKFLLEILTAMKKYFDYRIRRVMKSRQSRFGRLYIDNTGYMNVLVEMGFIGNREELEILLYQRDRIVESIAHGILNFFRKRE